MASSTIGRHPSSPIEIVSIDTDVASKVSDSRRHRTREHCRRFRQRTKERDQKIRSQGQQIRELVEELESVRTERDYFRSIATPLLGSYDRLTQGHDS